MGTDKKRWRLLAISQTNLPSIFDFAKKPLLAGLWCLYVSKHQFHNDYLSYQDIGLILHEYLDIPVTVNQIKKAFAPVMGDKVMKNHSGEACKISNPGEIYLKGLKKDESLNIVYVNPSKPRTASKSLEEMVKSIPKDELLICDPYYGIRTLDVLEAFVLHHKNIKFLTARVGGGENKALLTRKIIDFKKEFGKKVEIRTVSGSDLHDRYILAKDQFLIIGHGIKDLGNRESLIVVVQDKYGKDIRKTLVSSFNSRWSTGAVL